MVTRSFLAAMVSLLGLAAMASTGVATAEGLSTPSPENAEVYFIAPTDGAVVGETFVVRFGLRGMGVAPAGAEIADTGHHHLLIDNPEVDMSLPLPTTDQVRHFGKGQTETEITLEPGEYTLTLLLGNHLHVPHTPPVMSQPVHITVRADRD